LVVLRGATLLEATLTSASLIRAPSNSVTLRTVDGGALAGGAAHAAMTSAKPEAITVKIRRIRPPTTALRARDRKGGAAMILHVGLAHGHSTRLPLCNAALTTKRATQRIRELTSSVRSVLRVRRSIAGRAKRQGRATNLEHSDRWDIQERIPGLGAPPRSSNLTMAESDDAVCSPPRGI